jgi:hypothetical protein
MARTAEQNEALRDKRKTKILDRSLKLFALKGFDNVSVNDIVAVSGCSHGLFYHYYQSKEEIYNALVKIKNEKYASYCVPMDEIKKTGGMEGLMMLGAACEKILTGEDNVLYFAALASNRHYSTATYKESLLGEDPYPMLVNLLKEAQAEGNILTADPCELANLFIDTLNGAMERRLLSGREHFCIVPYDKFLRLFRN